MSLPSRSDAPPAHQPPDPVADRLAQWQREGASQADPLRFAYLQALARRAQAASPAVQQRLAPRLELALANYAERLAQLQAQALEQGAALAARHPALARQLRALQAAGDLHGIRQLALTRRAEPPATALTALTAHLNDVSPTVQGADLAGREELASVRRFRRAWSRGRTQLQLAQAAARKPSQAGPLNSHALVLESLALMQALSPDYLRHFMGHVEALQWIEQAREARLTAKPAKTAKPLKPARPNKSTSPAKTVAAPKPASRRTRGPGDGA